MNLGKFFILLQKISTYSSNAHLFSDSIFEYIAKEAHEHSTNIYL